MSSHRTPSTMKTSCRKFDFPFKLHKLLDFVQTTQQDHVISWHSSGQAFRIYDPSALEEVIMPSFFGQTKYKSFVRQLNIYGFKRIRDRRSEFRWCYYNENFVRGKPELCRFMKRVKVIGNGSRKSKVNGGGSEVSRSTFSNLPSIAPSRVNQAQEQFEESAMSPMYNQILPAPVACTEKDAALHVTIEPVQYQSLSYAMPVTHQRNQPTSNGLSSKSVLPSPEEVYMFNSLGRAVYGDNYYDTSAQEITNRSGPTELRSDNLIPDLDPIVSKDLLDLFPGCSDLLDPFPLFSNDKVPTFSV